MSEGPREPVGGVGEEAAKLLQALQDWARDSGSEYAEATAQAAAGAGARMHDLHEHLATGGPECRYCPVCQVISAVRGTSPEVRAHLGAAATSLMRAAASLLDTPVPDPGRDRRSASVDKIELNDDDEWEDD